jgi:hypothetical protein
MHTADPYSTPLRALAVIVQSPLHLSESNSVRSVCRPAPISHGERGVRGGGGRGVHGAVPGAAHGARAPLRGVQDRRLPGAGGGRQGGRPGRRLRRPHRQPPRRRLPLRRLRPRLHRRRRHRAGRRGRGAPQQDLLRVVVPGDGGREEQDGVRELLRGVQEGAGRRADRPAGHGAQRAHPRRPKRPRLLNPNIHSPVTTYTYAYLCTAYVTMYVRVAWVLRCRVRIVSCGRVPVAVTCTNKLTDG